MNRRISARVVIAAAVLLGGASLSAACVAPTGSAVGTPAAPGQQGSSRLPTLLQQVQKNAGAMELFDSPSSEVLAAQDQQGKFATDVTPTAVATPTAARTPTSIALTNPTATPARTVRATVTSAPSQSPTDTPTSTATPTATTPAPTASPRPTATPTSTPTSAPTPPHEGTPPTEG